MAKPRKVIRKDGNVVWEAYVREGGRGSKEIRRRFSTCKEAQAFVDEFKYEKKELRQGFLKVGSFSTTTFREESERWLENLRLRSSPSHFRRCSDMIKDFNATYGNFELNQITSEFLASLQAKLKSRPGKQPKTTLSNSSVNRYTEAICAVLNFSTSQKRIPYSPAAGFKKLPKRATEMLFWDEREARDFLAWASKKYTWKTNKSRLARKYYIVYLMALNTGMRAGEIWGLKPRDLSFNADGDGDTIFVRRQLNRLSREFAPLKGGVGGGKDKSRHVPCPKELRRELEAMLQYNGTGPDEPVFQNMFDGGPMDHDNFARRFWNDLEKWGGRRIRFHDLRHTAATLMLSKGVDVKTVSAILGHEDIGTTMIYVHLLGDRIKQVSRSFVIQPAEPEKSSEPAPNS